MTLRLLIADDHAIVRRGLAAIVDAEADLSVVAESGDGASAVAATLELDPDVVVLDLSMPRMTGLQAVRELRARGCDTPALLLSMHDDEQYVAEAIRAGAQGYVRKSTADRDLLAACRAAADGAAFVYPPDIGDAAVDQLERVRGGSEERVDVLTGRELEIVRLVADAKTNDQIAAALVISPKTVERHRANILHKLGMRDRVELVRYAVRRGLVDPFRLPE